MDGDGADKDLVIDPARGRMLSPNAAPAAPLTVDYYYCGFPGPIGAGSYDRSGGLGTPTVAGLGGGAIPAGAIDPGSTGAAGVTRFGDSSTWTGPSIFPVQNAL